MPKSLRRPTIVALAAGLLVGCGGTDPVSPPPAPPPAPVASVSVTPLTAVLMPGETIGATATARSAQGASLAATVTWSSSDQSVATVTSTGTVTAVGNGTATISATAGSFSGSVVIEVEPAGLRRLVDSVRRAHGLPAMGGAIISVAAGTEALAVAGTRRASGGARVDPADKWHIGSNLKAITSALAAIAVDEGRIAWTTTVADAFPELGTAIRTEYRTVTLADLLAHRGGIRNDPPAAAFAGATAAAQRQSLVSWTLGAAPIGPVGTFVYSNPGYVVAAAMLERAWTGVYEDLLATRLLAPLGATGLGWGPQAAPGALDQPAAHSWQGGAWVVCEGCDNPPGMSAAGRAHLPLADWARIVREMLRADQGTSTLISAANGRSLFTERVPVAGTDGYGLGWVLVTRGWAGGRAASHSGSNLVNHSVAWLGLGRGIGFIAVTNAADLVTERTALALDGLIGRMIRFRDNGS